MKILILYHSRFSHIHWIAEAVTQGVSEVPGVDMILRRVPETLPEELLE